MARYGGEEFCVLPHTEHEGAVQAAERLRAAVSQISIPWENETLTATVSTGMACARDTKEALNSLLHRADAALYRAKAEGPQPRGGVQRGSRSGLTQQAARRLSGSDQRL